METGRQRTPHYANLFFGGWLFLSAFLWPHTAEFFHTAWIVGLLIAGFALGALRVQSLRWVNTLLALGLLGATLLASVISTATYWNNLIVGALVLICSLAAGYGAGTLTTSERRPRRRI